MRTTPKSPRTDKLLGLEGLRFLATFAVLLWHYQHFAYVDGKLVDFAKSDQPFYSVLFPFYDAGSCGVWFFWCISGFIFFWKYRTPIAERSIEGWTFFVFRLSRLYPLHLATLFAVALLQAAYFHLHGYFFVYQNNDAPHFLAQLLMAADWGPERELSFNGPIWSVSLEVLVYACFFFTLRYVTTSPLVGVLFWFACASFDPYLAKCVMLFYAGGMAAVCRQMASSSRFLLPIEITAWGAAGLAAIVIASGRKPEWTHVLMATPILLFCLSGPMALPAWLERPLETAGNMTYSCYLLHFPLQLTIATGFAFAQRPIPYQEQWFWVAYMLPTLLASHFIYRYFEAPAQAMIRAFLVSRPLRLQDGSAISR